ncbi:MAG: efflux transporter, family, subunit, partial [Bacteroidota bacterium]|nr:efflux transporter, family, subunit [Bacteroidota bacterium]
RGLEETHHLKPHHYYLNKISNENMKNIISIAVILFLTGCSQNKPVDLAEKVAVTNMETVKIEKGNLSSVIKLPGQLKPFEKVDIYPKVNGFVKTMLVDRGSIVHEGQVLMTLEAPELDQQLQAAQAKLIQAQEAINASGDRYHRLNAASKTNGAVSELDLVNARSKFQADSAFYRSEEANVSAVQTLKDYLVVKAPFDGIITERNVHPGTLTGPNFKMDNKPLLVLQDNRKLRLEVFIPEEYAQKVDPKDNGLAFSTESYPDKTFTAKISRSSNSLYDEYRSEAIEADVPNSDNTFKPGMYVETDLKVKSDVQSYLVPASAILTSTERKYVVTVLNGKTRFINIKEGISNNGKTEVFGKFNGEEIVLKNPNNELKEGVDIK